MCNAVGVCKSLTISSCWFGCISQQMLKTHVLHDRENIDLEAVLTMFMSGLCHNVSITISAALLSFVQIFHGVILLSNRSVIMGQA